MKQYETFPYLPGGVELKFVPHNIHYSVSLPPFFRSRNAHTFKSRHTFEL
jgi:hypothetical protein